MSTILNRNIIETNNFSNQLLGPFSFIVHKLSGEGDFIAEVYELGKLISRFSILCSKDFRETQEHVDLSLANNQMLKSTLRLNNENGYVLFYNSKEYKNHQVIIKKGNIIEFNSTEPNSKDLFGLNLLKPGQYKLSSASLKTDLILDVKYPSLDDAQIGRATGSIQLDAAKVLANKSQTILPNQGVVFNFADNFKDFNIVLVKENLPKVNKTIIDEFKAKANLTNKKNKKEGVIKKYSLKK